MKYDFDEKIQRHNTDCVKYDLAPRLGKPADTIPLWVADMDFRVPPAVTDRLLAVVKHGIYGYGDADEAYFSSVHNWFRDHHGFETKAEWVIKAPGVVFSLASAIRGLTSPGDAIIIQEPVYHPFARMIQINERRVVNNGLVCENGRYSMDLDDFEKKIVEHQVKMFVLCNPHNPVGRVWSRDELTALGEICLRHDCVVLSDEIHCDFVRPGHQHHVWATLSPQMAQNCVICTAPSKTFNLAGLQASTMFVPNPDIHRKVKLAVNRAGYDGLSVTALAACQAAYEHGKEWLEQLKVYLEGNLAFLKEAAAELPGLNIIEPEGTYLLWLDFRSLAMSPAELDRLLCEKARLWLDEGQKFGQSGTGFYRLNMACPRSTLREAMRRLKEVWPE